MRRVRALAMAFAIVAAACGSDSSESADTTPVATEVAGEPEPEPPATDTPEPEPEPTDPPEPEPTDPPPTNAPETTTTTEPPPPLNAVGLVPLPGAQLDFSATAVPNPSLVWSLYSGSGGIAVENVGGPLPPGCHGTSFFDPLTFDLLQIDGIDAQAYATRGDGGCDNMQDLEAGVADGDAVRINTDDLILFDFGALPQPPFDVSTQVVNPGGQNGVFRASDPDAPLFDNRLDDTDLTHVIGADVLLEVELATGELTLVRPPLPNPGNCIDFDFCLFDRFGVEITDVDGNAGQVLVSSEKAGLFTFLDEAEWKALVRIVNGCQFNDHFWVFAAASTNVEFDLTVTDPSTGEARSYFNPLDNLPEPIVDTQAFATCP